MTYEISANVYAKKMGPLFGRTVRTHIEAENLNEAFAEAHKNFRTYCGALKTHHNNDFEFDDVRVNDIKEIKDEAAE